MDRHTNISRHVFVLMLMQSYLVNIFLQRKKWHCYKEHSFIRIAKGQSLDPACLGFELFDANGLILPFLLFAFLYIQPSLLALHYRWLAQLQNAYRQTETLREMFVCNFVLLSLKVSL